MVEGLFDASLGTTVVEGLFDASVRRFTEILNLVSPLNRFSLISVSPEI